MGPLFIKGTGRIDLNEDKILTLIKKGKLYGIKANNKEGVVKDILLNVVFRFELETENGRAVWIPGRKGYDLLKNLRETTAAQISMPDGRIIYVDSKEQLPLTEKKYLEVSEDGDKTFISVDEANRYQKARLPLIDVVILPKNIEGEYAIVSYNEVNEEAKAYDKEYFISVRNATTGKFKKYPLIWDEAKGTLISKEFDISTIKRVSPKSRDRYKKIETLISPINIPYLGFRPKAGLTGEALVLKNEEGKITDLIDYSSPTKIIFDAVDYALYGYQVIAQTKSIPSMFKLYKDKDSMPTSWVTEGRQYEILKVGKPKYTDNVDTKDVNEYDFNLARIAKKLNYQTTKEGLDEFETDYEGTIFDIRGGIDGLIVYTEMSKYASWMIRYRDDQKRIVTEVLQLKERADGHEEMMTVYREITPKIITEFTYDENLKEIGANNYLISVELEDLRKFMTVQEIVNKIENSKETRISYSKVETDYTNIPQLGKVKTLIKHFADNSNYNLKFLYELSDLKWVKISWIIPYGQRKGQVYHEEYQAFSEDSSSPFIKLKIDNLITNKPDNMVDIVFNHSNGKEKLVSLRFDLDQKANDLFEPEAISAKIGYNKELIIDLYKQLIFVDIRDKDQGFWEGREHLRVNGTFDKNWNSILSSHEAISKYAVERYEEFDYEKCKDYSSSLLKALDIPCSPQTKYYLHNKGNKLIGEGQLITKGIDWDNGLIISDNRVFFYNPEKGDEPVAVVEYRAWRDFKGNVRIQTFSIEGKNILAIYVDDFDKYGVGQKSVVMEKDTDKLWKLSEAGMFNESIKGIKLGDYSANLHNNNMFLFEVTKLAKPMVVNFNEENPIESYPEFRSLLNNWRSDVLPSLRKDEAIKEKYTIAKSGAGKILVRMDGFEINNLGRAVGDPSWIMFALYKDELLSATEAGPLHFGYGPENFTYKYNKSNGLSSEKYIELNLLGRTKKSVDRIRNIFRDEDEQVSKSNWHYSNWKARTNGLRVKEIDKKAVIVYDIEDKRKGKALQRQWVLNPWGSLVMMVNANAKVGVINGFLNYSTKGSETTKYGSLQIPSEATDDEGRVIKRWKNIKYEITPQGQIKETHTLIKTNPLGPNISHEYDLILVNGDFEDEIRTDVKSSWLEGLKSGRIWIIIPFGLLMAAIFIGFLFKQRRIYKVIRRLKQNLNNTRNMVSINQQETRPSYDGHGFEQGVVDAAKYSFRVVENRLKNNREENSLERILEEYLFEYKTWRKQVMKIQGNFEPTIEDLWIFFLIKEGCIYFQNDTPSFLNYMLHKAKEFKSAARSNEVGPFVNTSATRWFTINHYTSTVFKSFGPMGGAANTVPFQYLFNIQDIEELFRTKGFIDFYDSLGPTQQENLYDETFIPKLIKISSALKNVATSLGGMFGGDKIKTKEAVVKTKEYRDYVEFFESECTKLRPLFCKTYSDTIGFAWGVGPLKTWAHVFRNFHQTISITTTVVLISLMVALAFHGTLTVGSVISVVSVAALIWLIKKPISYCLEKGFSKRSNINTYGTPVRPDEGYKKPFVELRVKVGRWVFWVVILLTKLIWNSVVFYWSLIAHAELWGAVWAPILGIDLNFILIAGLWLPFILFFFLDTFSLYYIMESLIGYIQGARLGLGIIKTIRQKNKYKNAPSGDLIVGLIKDKFIPKGLKIKGSILSDNEKMVMVAEIINLIVSTLYEEDMITLEERDHNLWTINRQDSDDFYNATVTEAQGFFSDIRNDKAKQRIIRFLNSLFMDIPDMPLWEDIRTLTVMTPVAPGESIIYTWEDLIMEEGTGHIKINYLIGRYADEWENFLNRLRRENKISLYELDCLRSFEFNKITNLVLIMDIRLWASYHFQPFARTLRGVMHYVPVLQLLAKMNHPTWGMDTITAEVENKFQMLWGCYFKFLGKAMPDEAKNMIVLAKLYYEKYNYKIDIADLPSCDNDFKFDFGGTHYSILQQYNPDSETIEDVIRIKLGNIYPFSNEGKPGCQTHTRRYARGEAIMTFDINQDYYIEQIFKMPHLLTQLDDKDVAIVGYPEDIFTDTYSMIGKFHAVADRTFNSLVQRQLSMLGVRFHYGHPDIWRAAYVDATGGVSRSFPVNEDIFGGYTMVMKGKKIINVEYIEAGKAREISWVTTDGIFRKFGMGAVQQMYDRYLKYINTSELFGITERLSHVYGAIGYYIRKVPAQLGIYGYIVFMLLLGVSGFAPFPNEIIFAALGIFGFAQAITTTGFMQEITDRPFIKGTFVFGCTLMLMSPFFMAHVFTMAVGASLAMSGVAAYVATGRGFILNHTPLCNEKDNNNGLYKGFGKSHVSPAAFMVALSVWAIVVWSNPTLWWSTPYLLIIFFAMIVPFVSNRGFMPIFGVSAEKSCGLWVQDFKQYKFIWNNIVLKEWNNRGFLAFVFELIRFVLFFAAWLGISITFIPLTLIYRLTVDRIGKYININLTPQDIVNRSGSNSILTTYQSKGLWNILSIKEKIILWIKELKNGLHRIAVKELGANIYIPFIYDILEFLRKIKYFYHKEFKRSF
ncbi:MAG: hypothetical protein HQ538_05775, partial [Parcubacteria group bacterium]|nr:hypothetical protein [Parcubacteria group bacterium]